MCKANSGDSGALRIEVTETPIKTVIATMHM